MLRLGRRHQSEVVMDIRRTLLHVPTHWYLRHCLLMLTKLLSLGSWFLAGVLDLSHSWAPCIGLLVRRSWVTSVFPIWRF